jgi:hypothetical protein
MKYRTCTPLPDRPWMTVRIATVAIFPFGCTWDAMPVLGAKEDWLDMDLVREFL